jgi:hypothetical protein
MAEQKMSCSRMMQDGMQSAKQKVAALLGHGWVYVCAADCSLKMGGRGMRLVGRELNKSRLETPPATVRNNKRQARPQAGAGSRVSGA